MESWGSLVNEFQEKVNNLVARFEEELLKVRQSGVDLDQLKNIQVEAYSSSEMPLYQLATLTVKDALTVVVSPWDKSIIEQVEKAIKNSLPEVRLAIKDEGIIVGFPPLTEESLKIIIKKLHNLTEDFRQQLRRIRNHYKSRMDEAKNNNEISDDSYYKFLGKIDDITKKGREMLEKLSKEKENKILVK